MATGEPDPAATGARRWRIPLVLLLLFLGPLVLAWILYFGSPGLRPHDTVNHGELVEPPVLLPAFEHNGATLLRDTWTLVHIDAGGCRTLCRGALRDSRQVRLALGRRSDRLRRLLLLADVDGAGPDLAGEHPDLVVVSLATQADLLEAFASRDLAHEPGRIYLVDPLGNLMMTYPPDADAGGLLDDLERLLRLSHIG